MEINLTTFLFILLSVMTAILFVLNEIIKASIRKAVRDVLNKELFSLKAYKVAELKRLGITEKEISDARTYLSNRKKSIPDNESFWSKPSR